MRAILLTLLLLLLSSTAQADCTPPAPPTCSGAGKWEYDATSNSYRFCDGTNWQTMKGAGTIGTCSTAGAFEYSAADSNFRFCDGTNWIPVANDGTLGACSGDPAIGYDTTNNVLKWCNGTNWIGMKGTGGGSPTYNCVFVTTSEWTGSGIGGIAGADAKCATAASSASLDGTYKAWIATDATNDPESRFPQSSLPYKMVDGTLIANDWADLTDGVGASTGGLITQINLTESGTLVDGDGIDATKTGVTGDGTSTGTDCSDWGSTSGSGTAGSTGSFAGDGWTDISDSTCAAAGHLYCFQQ